MSHLPALVLSATLIPACVVYDSDARPNTAPWVDYVEAGCLWDPAYGDDFWYFYAETDDPEGPMDVTWVWADVVDDWTGQTVESFDLVDLSAFEWYTEAPAHTTRLDCWYPGYVVWFTAEDAVGQRTTVTTVPFTY